MRHIGPSVEIGADVSAVWDLLAGFEHWPRWGPTVRAVRSDAAAVAEGVGGRLQTVIGIWLPFEITEVEPQRSWDWKVAGIPATRHYLDPIGERRTRARFTVAWPAAPYAVILWIGLRRLKTMAEAA